MRRGDRLRIFTWHVHGAYLYYLSQVPHDIYVPVMEGRPEGYGGRAGTLPWPDNLHEVPAESVKELELDCLLFQSNRNYLIDQHDILSDEQQKLPRIYLEHDPPQESPTNTAHVVDDPDVLLVHVTHFNDLMWDSGRTPTRVIEHGVMVSEHLRYTGELPRGISVVNGLPKRGRRLGLDVFERARREVDIDLVGMQSEALDGLGERTSAELFELETHYRFHFSPIRYTSLGLAICEAMMLGLPIVGLATTELSTVIENGRSGYIDTDVTRLIDYMKDLLRDPGEAHRLGNGARATALERFNIRRFIDDWNDAFAAVTETSPQPFHAAGKAAIP
jgi:hypothetical protein